MRKNAMIAMAAAWLLPMAALAAQMQDLLGQPVQALNGERVGAVQDLIVDVDAGRVLYVIVQGGQAFHTLPVRALDERLRLDMDLANAMARDQNRDDPKFRRAARLVGQPVEQPGGPRIGTIADIEFDLESGQVERVVVSTSDGPRDMPASVLAQGHFPPLTRWQAEHPPAEVSGEPGFVRREPSDERRSLHDPKW